MSPRPAPVRLLAAAVTTAVLSALLVLAPAPAQAAPIEGYADYVGARKCSPRAKPGTRQLGRWIVRTHGGGFGPISRSCSRSSASEHEEGRAFDWTLDATRRPDRLAAERFLDQVFARDRAGNRDALARRMGIMYIIWNDRIYRSYADEFAPGRYLSSSCRSRKRCSKTLRHRDHMHLSLSWRGARGNTSWYR